MYYNIAMVNKPIDKDIETYNPTKAQTNTNAKNDQLNPEFLLGKKLRSF